MEILSKLFGSEAKVKIIRLFLFNPQHVFSSKEIMQRSKLTSSQVRKETLMMEKIGLVKRRARTSKKSKGHGFVLNSNFSYLVPLQNFLINLEPLNPKGILKRIVRMGSIKLVIVSGVFLQQPDSRVDLLIVGDNVRKTTLLNMIKTMESEVGKELKYAYFTTSDFKYRLGMFDKLIRDILDYPHKMILNKLGIV